jgi:Sec7 domain
MDTTNEAPAAENKEARMAEMKAIREGARRLRKAALDAIAQILKVNPKSICFLLYRSLMLTIILQLQCLARTAAVATGNQFFALVSSWADPNDPDDFLQDDPIPCDVSSGSESNDTDKRRVGPGGVLSFWQKEIASQHKPKSFYYNFETQSGLLSSVTRETAFQIAKKKSVKKAVEYLIACNALTPSPRDIASFLRVHKDMLDQGALGHYLGETGIDGHETEYWNLIRFSYVRAISFDGMKVEDA